LVLSPIEKIEEALKEVSAEISDRERLLVALEKVRQLAFYKMEHKNTISRGRNDRISWARVIINSCKVSDQIMKSKEQNELVREVLELKKAFQEMKDGNNVGEHKKGN
jgi:hypothetical protein